MGRNRVMNLVSNFLKKVAGSFVIATSLLQVAQPTLAENLVAPKAWSVGTMEWGSAFPIHDNLGGALADFTHYICVGLAIGCHVKPTDEYSSNGHYYQGVIYGYTYIGSTPNITVDGLSSFINVFFNCAVGTQSESNSGGKHLCKRPDRPQAEPVPCNSNEPVPCAGNPIILSVGAKYQVETDYSSGTGTLQFKRTYRSDIGTWSHNYEMSAIDMKHPERNAYQLPCVWSAGQLIHSNHCYEVAAEDSFYDLRIRRPNGRIIQFGSASTEGAMAPDGVDDLAWPLVDAAGVQIGWTVTNTADLTTETYDLSGKILRSIGLKGQITTFQYSDITTPVEIAPRSGLLIGVSDVFSRRLRFTYDVNGKMATMVDPSGGKYLYEYDLTGNLTKVTYPGGLSKTYLYNEPEKTSNADLPHALTGIIDENGERFATFTYDVTGRAISTEHAGGVQRYDISYPSTNNTVERTPLGMERIYTFQPIAGLLKNTGKTQPSASGTGNVTSSVTYDEKGRVTSKIDLNGMRTTFAYEPFSNLETRRTEADGTPDARSISTKWNSQRLQTVIAAPKIIKTFAYDLAGNMLTMTEQATSDLNGAFGFNSIPVGKARTWRYTYNAAGQKLTAKGPRSDIDDITKYSYDSDGNLIAVTNAAGQVTSYSNYDANGRAGRITAPNGLVTELTYSPRGWLTSRTVGNETTRYTYDGVGNLTAVTLPDGAAISYVYDAAHRLTDIADGIGNKIHYTLDVMGNRIGEQIGDPNGTLTRQVTRAYNALNRLQQVTGSMQ